jgi:hypothetical protein
VCVCVCVCARARARVPGVNRDESVGGHALPLLATLGRLAEGLRRRSPGQTGPFN